MKEKFQYPYLQRKLSHQFSCLGKLIARHYLWFFFIPVLMALILSTGFLKYKVNRDTDYLFTATNERANRAKDLAERLFPMNTSIYSDSTRISKPNDMCLILIYSKSDKNLFDEKIFEEIATLDKIIKNITVEWDGKLVNYSTLCGKKNGKCVESEVIKLIPHIKEIISGKYKIKYPVDLNKLTFVYTQYVFSLGGVKLNRKGYVEEIKSARLLYLLDKTNKKKHEAIERWKSVFNEVLKTQEFRYISYTFLNSFLLQGELEEYSNCLVPLIPICFVLVLIFSFVICMTNDTIKGKPWLGSMACISACLSVLSGMGMLLWFGFEKVDVVFALFFSVLAMEIDDAFILIAAWRSTDPEDSVENRMEKTYSEAAVSIFITSFTSFLSFCIGMCSIFPGIRIFTYFAGAFVCFTYIYLMTFFGSCLVISGYREQKRLHCITLQKVKDSKNEVMRNGNVSLKEEFIMSQFRDKIGNFLTRKSIKFSVMFIFLCNLGIALWGLTFTQAGNNFSDAFKDESKFSLFFKLNKHYYQYGYAINVIVNEPLNYADPLVQNSVETLCKRFENHPNIADSSLRLSWLKEFLKIQASPVGKFLFSSYNMSNELDFIDALRNVFLKFQQAKEFNYDIAFNENYTKIIASRFLFPTINIKTEFHEASLMIDSYKIIDQSPISATVDGLHFHLIEQMFLIKKATFQTALITSSLICLVFLIFITNIKIVLPVTIIVFCIIFETIGYMSLWNVKLDMVSLVTLILCVGFSINYPTHISISFFTATDMDQNERLKKSIYEVGFPIFQGSTTTILGILILSFQPFYSVVSFFKIIFLIAMQTTFHAMFVIPVVLSIVGNYNVSFFSVRNAISNFKFSNKKR
ncbi:patched domain-containing protein 3-like [Centruroides vittatus]|uniref:patched domain-containing protein 3-like n=1 Tax=Centruroides vittatus TaxID=120091 RepID=UPI00350EC5BF